MTDLKRIWLTYFYAGCIACNLANAHYNLAMRYSHPFFDDFIRHDMANGFFYEFPGPDHGPFLDSVIEEIYRRSGGDESKVTVEMIEEAWHNPNNISKAGASPMPPSETCDISR